MANEFLIRKGLIVSGSTQMTGSLDASGSVSASDGYALIENDSVAVRMIYNSESGSLDFIFN
jgi:hypothetical protein